MAEHYLRQSALAHLGLAARADTSPGETGIVMAELLHRGIVDLRGPADDSAFTAAVEMTLGFALPLEACTAGGTMQAAALWQGPDEWWIVTPENGPAMAETLRKALKGQHAAVTDIGESRACMRIAGPRSRDLLTKGCPLDLHPRVFGAGRCAGSMLAKAGVTLHQISDDSDAMGPAFEIYVLRSFADYLWRWLEDAAREYGLTVTTG